MTVRIPDTEKRVELKTQQDVNEKIGRDIEARACYYAARHADIDRRLKEIRREWDIERTLEANAAGLSVMGLLLGATVSKKWFLLPAVVGGFLIQHAIQGWCPPLPLLRRLGVRTTGEINRERYTLKALRGDFDNASSPGDEPVNIKVQKVLHAVDRL